MSPYEENFEDLYDDTLNYSDGMNSSADYSPEEPEIEQIMSVTLSLIIYALAFLLGVPGNVAVIWVTGFKMKRSVNTVCFLNLAVADLTYCLILPFQMANVALRHVWPTDDVLCKLIPTTTVLNMSASVFLLTLISIDRCLAVTRPIWSQTHRSLPWVRAACFGVWGLAFLMCLPTLLIRKVVTHPDLGLSFCYVNYSGTYFGERTKAVVEITRSLLAFALPFLIMAFCYLLIGCKLQRSKFAKSKKTIRLIAVVVGAFFVCWLPYHACGLAQAFTSSPAALVWDSVAVGLGSLNSALNPLLYMFAGRNFRQVFRRSLTASLLLAFTEEPTDSVCTTRVKTACSVEDSV
ncbi:C3a anaphylatoxin chemotactic receptor-like [Pristis pectinata]|uniref:C3a anaphylatoxin chemotactic receptor-like n=1 Tax=Pristis pectinata TaxID=685728 RepID=UPI00223CF420|nr:C3a anaphylatoxin chemotactic receptor-like [Pristis pectinata]